MTSKNLRAATAYTAARYVSDKIVQVGLWFDGEVWVLLVGQVESFVGSYSVVTNLATRTLHHWYGLEYFQARAGTSELLSKTVSVTLQHDKRVSGPQRLETFWALGYLSSLGMSGHNVNVT